MPLPPLKDLPFSGAYKMLGNIFVPIMGAMALATLAAQFWRGRTDGLSVASIASGIAVIGVSYYAFRRAIGRLAAAIDEKSLSNLLVAANSMAFFGYLTCITAVVFGRDH